MFEMLRKWKKEFSIMSLDSRRKKNSSRTLNSENGGKIPRLVFKCPVCFRWEPSNTINSFQKLLFEEVFSVTEKTSLVTEKPLRHCRIPVTPLLSWSPADWTQELETSWRQTDTGRSCRAGTPGKAWLGLELSSHPRTRPSTHRGIQIASLHSWVPGTALCCKVISDKEKAHLPLH